MTADVGRGRGLTLLAIGIGIVAISLFPVYWMVISSLRSVTGIFAYPPQFFPEAPTLDAYREAVIENPLIRRTVATNAFVGQYGTERNNIRAVATTVAVPILIVFAALQHSIVGGITAGATKE